MNKPLKTIEKLQFGEEVKIAAFGDSLTYGWMVEQGYIDYLKTMFAEGFPGCNFHIYNRGVPGDTANDGLRRIENDIIRLKPDIVLIQFALNDAYMNYSPEEFQKNLDALIIKIKKDTSSEIVLMTSSAVLNKDERIYVGKFYDKIFESGEKYKLPVAAVNKYWETQILSGTVHSSLLQMDGVHPTEKGYKLMAEAVFKIFK